MNIQDIIDAVVSECQRTGRFDAVNAHEPKSSPSNGITAAVWVNRIQSIKQGGLNSTSLRVEINVRIYTNMLTEPQDLIDVNMVTAMDDVMARFSGNFQLDALTDLRSIDLKGAYGQGLEAQAGYLDVSGALYRCITITVPLIMNDIWEQVA